MAKILRPEVSKGDLLDTDHGNYYVDTEGVEWFHVGANCKGPKITVITKEKDDDGPEKTVTVWLRAGPGYNLSDKDYNLLLKDPSRARRWRKEERPEVDKKLLERFRSGCGVDNFIQSSELDGVNKGVACRDCGTISEFHGLPVEGTAAWDAQEKARIAAEADAMTESGDSSEE